MIPALAIGKELSPGQSTAIRSAAWSSLRLRAAVRHGCSSPNHDAGIRVGLSPAARAGLEKSGKPKPRGAQAGCSGRSVAAQTSSPRIVGIERTRNGPGPGLGCLRLLRRLRRRPGGRLRRRYASLPCRHLERGTCQCTGRPGPVAPRVAPWQTPPMEESFASEFLVGMNS
jgi:hypothetical protein